MDPRVAPSWSAAQYSKFEKERNRPIFDLLAQVPAETAATALDLGCGPGNSTEILSRRFPAAVICGIDSSADMIAAARRRLPAVRFAIADVATFAEPGPFDVILANAVLHWVPDHARLLPALIGKLAAGGSLAVQMPDNLDEPSHRLMREVAAAGRWADKLRGAAGARTPQHSADWYYQTLRACASTQAPLDLIDVWRTTYHHPLAGGAAAVVEWFKGSGLRPFLDPLDTDERQEYLARYEEKIARAYPALADGTVLLPFPRLFFVATRGG
jgi:trans-aconitate 2-methyltransferase